MNIYKALSIVKDIETLQTGNKKKIIKRAKNKVKGKILNKALNKIGYWSK